MAEAHEVLTAVGWEAFPFIRMYIFIELDVWIRWCRRKSNGAKTFFSILFLCKLINGQTSAENNLFTKRIFQRLKSHTKCSLVVVCLLLPLYCATSDNNEEDDKQKTNEERERHTQNGRKTYPYGQKECPFLLCVRVFQFDYRSFVFIFFLCVRSRVNEWHEKLDAVFCQIHFDWWFNIGKVFGLSETARKKNIKYIQKWPEKGRKSRSDLCLWLKWDRLASFEWLRYFSLPLPLSSYRYCHSAVVTVITVVVVVDFVFDVCVYVCIVWSSPIRSCAFFFISCVWKRSRRDQSSHYLHRLTQYFPLLKWIFVNPFIVDVVSAHMPLYTYYVVATTPELKMLSLPLSIYGMKSNRLVCRLKSIGECVRAVYLRLELLRLKAQSKLAVLAASHHIHIMLIHFCISLRTRAHALCIVCAFIRAFKSKYWIVSEEKRKICQWHFIVFARCNEFPSFRLPFSFCSVSTEWAHTHTHTYTKLRRHGSWWVALGLGIVETYVVYIWKMVPIGTICLAFMFLLALLFRLHACMHIRCVCVYKYIKCWLWIVDRASLNTLFVRIT